MASNWTVGVFPGPMGPALVGVVCLCSTPQSNDGPVALYNTSFSGHCSTIEHSVDSSGLSAADLHAVLDLAKVVDTLLFVLDPTEGWDSYGDYCLSCLFAQGLPSHGMDRYNAYIQTYSQETCESGTHFINLYSLIL